jgi:hypothetical protein
LHSWHFFACFCGVCLFSWLIGRLASNVYRLFGRLASCFFHMPMSSFMKTCRSSGS